ncbi:MAG: toxin ParE1/3/4 [Marivirga sp.]|jgi:toxin ParE1/3/4
MKYTLIVKPEAELDILKSSQWYEEKQKDLGLLFRDEVEEKSLFITKNPLHYQVRYKATLVALVTHFPGVIPFIIEAEKVLVLAVLGTREDPEKWNK